jgi:hypothetical protein
MDSATIGALCACWLCDWFTRARLEQRHLAEERQPARIFDQKYARLGVALFRLH